MPLVNAKCTNCGATLRVADTKEEAICEYCGSAFIVEKAINNFNITHNNSFVAKTINIFTSDEITEESKADYNDVFTKTCELFLLLISRNSDYGICFLPLEKLKNQIEKSRCEFSSKARNLYCQIISKISSAEVTLSSDDVFCLVEKVYPFDNDFLVDLVNKGVANAKRTKELLGKYNCFQFVSNMSLYDNLYNELQLGGIHHLNSYYFFQRVFFSSCIMEFQNGVVIYPSKDSFSSEYDYKKRVNLYLSTHAARHEKDLLEYRAARFSDGDNTVAMFIKDTNIDSFFNGIILQILEYRRQKRLCIYCGSPVKGVITKKCTVCDRKQ